MKTLLLFSLLTVSFLATTVANTIPNSAQPSTEQAVTEVSLQGVWTLVTLNGMEMEGTLTFNEDKTVKFVMAGNIIRDGVYTYMDKKLMIYEGDLTLPFEVVELTETSLTLKDDKGVIVLKR